MDEDGRGQPGMRLRCHAAELPVVAKAWRAGLVDARKVAVIGEQVSYLDPATAQAGRC